MHLHFFALAFATILLTHVATAVADVVVLRNGDRLSGSVVHKRDGKLVFSSTHAGRVKIPWEEVSTLTTDKPVSIMLDDRSAPVSDTLQSAGAGRVRLTGSHLETTLQDIAYLNPSPEQSGIGTSYRGRASLAATSTSGNNTGRRIYADAELAARARDYRYNLGFRVNRQRESGRQTASNWRANGNHDWFLDKRTFRYVRSSFEHDRYKDIDLRSTLGGGYGLQLIEDDRTSLSIRGGIDYVVLNQLAAANDAYPALGWGLRATHRLETGDIELFHDQDGFIGLTDGNDITLLSRTGLRAPIAAGMNASIQLNLDWEQDPAPGRKSTDSVLMVGLGYEW